MANFTKNENCPSSQKLLDYQRSKLAETTTAKIQRHLAKCEFCSAESHFYAQFPFDEEAQETTTAAGIPAPLYELAEALLKNRHLGSTALNSLLKRKKTRSR